jgi:hypothetical protein
LPSSYTLSLMGIAFQQLKQTQQIMNDKKYPITIEDLIPLIQACLKQIVENSNKIDDMQTENSKLAARIACLEKEQRRKNIVIFGVPTEADLKTVVDDVILKKLP